MNIVNGRPAFHTKYPEIFKETLMEPKMTEREELMSNFDYEHLAPHLQPLSKPFHDLAHEFIAQLEGVESFEINPGLRLLVQAKDCLVRAGRRKLT